MKYLFDTNVVSGLMRGNRNLRTKLRYQPSNAFAVSSIAYAALWFGAMSAPDSAELIVRLEDVTITVLDFDANDARRSGEIRSILRRAGTPIGPLDILIAGQAIARDLTLVTHNTREFSRVQGLRIEDWEA